jgi:hypothetical protein
MNIDANIAKLFLSSAGMNPKLIDLIVDLGPKMKGGKFEHFQDDGIDTWKYSGSSTDGNFDLTIRVVGKELAARLGSVLEDKK